MCLFVFSFLELPGFLFPFLFFFFWERKSYKITEKLEK